jgi:hypothetical protein
MTDAGARPLTFVSTTSTDCIAAEAPAPGAGTKIANDALPLVPDCGTVVPPPLHAVLKATKRIAAGKKRAWRFIATVYTTRVRRIKEKFSSLLHFQIAREGSSGPLAFCKRPLPPKIATLLPAHGTSSTARRAPSPGYGRPRRLAQLASLLALL